MLKVNPDFNLAINENFNLSVHSANSTKEYLYPKKSRFEVKQSKENKLFYWTLQSTNGLPILKSLAGYATLQLCLDNIEPVLQYGTNSNNYEVEAQNYNNGLYFTLHNSTGKKIAVSGNGKSYALKAPKVGYNIALKQQVPSNGTKKGIRSCVKNINAILVKNKKVLYFD